jgi:hypothetical protein
MLLTLLIKKIQSILACFNEGSSEGKYHTVLRQNDDGIIYGITYVDHNTKCVFNGSHLGKQYSAKAILQRCAEEQLARC